MKPQWRGRHKMDEMERHILFKSQRNAYFFLVLALVVWSLYESWQVFTWHTTLNLLPCLLLVTAVLIQGFSQLALLRRAVRDNEESDETGPLARLVVFACAVACAVATVGAAVILLCVRP